MAIYSTDTYEIVSIMNNFETDINSVTTFKYSTLYVKLLPEIHYLYIVPIVINPSYQLTQDDYDVYDKFVANVIPIFESVCYPTITNTRYEIAKSTANSAISPISMISSSATV